MDGMWHVSNLRCSMHGCPLPTSHKDARLVLCACMRALPRGVKSVRRVSFRSQGWKPGLALVICHPMCTLRTRVGGQKAERGSGRCSCSGRPVVLDSDCALWRQSVPREKTSSSVVFRNGGSCTPTMCFQVQSAGISVALRPAHPPLPSPASSATRALGWYIRLARKTHGSQSRAEPRPASAAARSMARPAAATPTTTIRAGTTTPGQPPLMVPHDSDGESLSLYWSPERMRLSGVDAAGSVSSAEKARAGGRLEPLSVAGGRSQPPRLELPAPGFSAPVLSAPVLPGSGSPAPGRTAPAFSGRSRMLPVERRAALGWPHACGQRR
eukprot:scaffold19337_cov128-Isochrysis_galbana.AAC.3